MSTQNKYAIYYRKNQTGHGDDVEFYVDKDIILSLLKLFSPSSSSSSSSCPLKYGNCFTFDFPQQTTTQENNQCQEGNNQCQEGNNQYQCQGEQGQQGEEPERNNEGEKEKRKGRRKQKRKSEYGLSEKDLMTKFMKIFSGQGDTKDCFGQLMDIVSTDILKNQSQSKKQPTTTGSKGKEEAEDVRSDEQGGEERGLEEEEEEIVVE